DRRMLERTKRQQKRLRARVRQEKAWIGERLRGELRRAQELRYRARHDGTAARARLRTIADLADYERWDRHALSLAGAAGEAFATAAIADARVRRLEQQLEALGQRSVADFWARYAP